MAQPRDAERSHTKGAAAILLLLAAVALALAPATASAATAKAAIRGHVLLIGMPGLQWDDIHDTATPNLSRLAAQGSSGALSIKTVGPHTCPIDGWLTVSAGQRSQLRHGSCGLPPAPEGTSAPGFAAMRDDNLHNKYNSHIGLLGDAVHKAGGCTMAIGPGAVIGAADDAGLVDSYVPSTDQLPADGLGRCALTMVDIDDVFHAYVDAGVDVNGHQKQVDPKKRATAVKRADAEVGAVLAGLPADTTVLVVGLSDANSSAHLRAAIASGPGFAGHYLTADSTRTGGLVTLTDVTATILHSLGLKQPADAVGSVWRTDGAKPASVSAFTKNLADHDVEAQAYSRFVLPFYLVLVIVQVALYGFGTFTIVRKKRRILAVTKVAALAGAALPVASFLANLVPWWSAGRPAVVLIAAILVLTAVITGLALAGPWRRSVAGAGAVIGGVTALVLTVDVFTGSHLQTCSMLGYTPIVAGRFYGFGNIPWALWITGLIIVTGAVAGRLLNAERRKAATALVIGAGVLALVIDGSPMAGADFGGIIAIIPGFAVFVFLIARWRIRIARLAIILAAGAVVVLGLAFLDSLRADPTHIGEFWDSLMNGHGGTIVFRKFLGMVGTFGNWELSVIAVAALAFLIFVLWRPLTLGVAVLHTAYGQSPALRATLIAVLVTAGTGMLVNDSGVAIPALAFTVAIPLALAASIQALGSAETVAPPRRSEPSEEASAPKA